MTEYIHKIREDTRTRIRVLDLCHEMLIEHNCDYIMGKEVDSALVLSRLSDLLTVAESRGHIRYEDVVQVYLQLPFEYPLPAPVRIELEEEQAG